MKHSLADFKGRYHSMPSTIMDLLTGDAFLIFSRIYAHSKKQYVKMKFKSQQKH